MSKLSYKTLLIILFFLLISIVVLWKFVLPNHKVSAAWWNDGWNYRVSVNIGNTGSSLANFQIPINIGTSTLINAGKMQSDCDDIRVVDQNGNLLTYWISGCGTTSTQIWPKIPSIPNGGATVYVYYGNPSAASVKTIIGTSGYPGLSCKSILDAGNSTGIGNYWIDPTNGDISDKFQAFCDMTNDSGGWMLVTQSMISSEIGTSVTTTKTTNTNGGVDISNLNNLSGCGPVAYYQVLFTDIIPWTKIKADYEFLGGHSCWSIFGNSGYSAGTNLIPFASATDTIRNQVKMGGSNGNNYDGVNSRCDNETFNFWHSNQGVGTTRSAQVILRRNSMSSLAGLGTGISCSTAGYPWKYKNIYIREDVMTFAVTATSSSEEVGGGPIAYWKFDEGIGTTALDSANNLNTGTITGATWQTENQCISGKCLYFNGSSYVNTNFGINRDISINPISVSMWVKPTSAGNYMFLSPNQGTNQLFYFATYSGKWDMGIQNSGWGGSGSINVDLNKWSHIEIVTTGSIAYMYVNGKITSQKNYTSFTFPENLYIGIHGSSGAYGFVGYVDDVKIYPYARSTTQIKQDYNSRGSLNGSSVNLGIQSSTAPSLSSKLIAYYKFDEGNGGSANNSGNGGSALNGTFGTGSSTPTWTNNGKFSKALTFDGGDYINIDHNWIRSGDWTITIWFKTSGNGYIICDSRSDYGDYNYGLYITGGILKGWNWPNAIGTKNVADNKWHQATYILNRTTGNRSLYVDGNLDTGDTNTIVAGTTGHWLLGMNGLKSGGFNGLIDEVKIYNTALTADEIKQDFNQGSAISFGSTNQTIGNTTTSLEYCIPGDTSYCSSPVAEWKMDEKTGTSAKDTSGNNNNGIISGATWTTGAVGAGLKFSGSGQAVSVVDNSTLKPTTAITTEAWFNTTDKTTTSQRILSKTEGSGYQLSINENSACPSNTLCFLVNINGTYYSATYASSNLSNNTWYHVAGLYDGSTVKLFLNGLNIGTTTTISNTITQAAYNLCIGSETDGGSCTSGFFKGKIDHVKIYNYARTPAQIAYGYNKGAPVGWWKLDDCQGLTAFDSSGLGNNGAISIGPSGTQNSAGTCQIGTSAAWTNGATGKYNSSLNFDGTDDYVDLGPLTSYNFTGRPNMTFAAWINVNNFVSNLGIISNGQGGGGTTVRFDWVIYSGNRLRLVWGDGVTYQDFFSSNNSINTNQWIHVAVTTNSNNQLQFYINGKPDNGVQTITNNLGISSVNWKIGRSYNSPSYTFNGKIDDVRVYNYALTSEQVKTVFNNGAVNFN